MIHVDPELKKHIIQQHLRDGRTITSLSDEYGYSREVISRWIREFRKAAFEDVQKKQVFLHGISQLLPVWQHVSQQTSASLQKSLKRRKKQKIICSLLALQIFVCVI